jgi:hypothetical protein
MFGPWCSGRGERVGLVWHIDLMVQNIFDFGAYIIKVIHKLKKDPHAIFDDTNCIELFLVKDDWKNLTKKQILNFKNKMD